MTEPRRVTLYTVSEEEVLLETPLTPGGYWMQCNHKPKPITNYNSGELAFEDPRQEYGLFYTEMQAHHVVNQFGEDMFVSFDPQVMEIFRACELKVRACELKAQLRANQNMRLEAEKRFEEDIKCLRAANSEIKFLQNTFVHFPLWRRLLIALFPSRHFK